ncbi:MAG: hypothetical protein Q9196_007487, partial [Gyalolechia fulgens]
TTAPVTTAFPLPLPPTPEKRKPVTASTASTPRICAAREVSGCGEWYPRPGTMEAVYTSRFPYAFRGIGKPGLGIRGGTYTSV